MTKPLFKGATETKLAKLREFSKSFPRSLCTCGHSGDGTNSFHADNILVKGHGFCSQCPCRKFRWNGWTAHYREFARGLK